MKKSSVGAQKKYPSPNSGEAANEASSLEAVAGSALDSIHGKSDDARQKVTKFLKEFGNDYSDKIIQEEMARNEAALNKLDTQEKPDIKEEDLLLKRKPMEALVVALERAIKMAKEPSSTSDIVIDYIREQIKNIENPHYALEQELDRLVEAKTPPNGELYKTRPDRSEFAVSFFHRVYGKFYEANVLYKHQLRAMDFGLYSLLAQLREQVLIPTKRDANDKKLSEVASRQEVWRMAKLISRRRKEAA